MTSVDVAEVTQADRDAAADLAVWHNRVAGEWEIPSGGTLQYFHAGFPDGLRRGVWDEHPFPQAFARHRIASTDALLTAHEAALERVRVAVSEAFKDAFIEFGAQGYGRDTPCQQKITTLLSQLEDRINSDLQDTRP